MENTNLSDTDNDVIGYRVQNVVYGFYVDTVDTTPRGGNFTTDLEPTPIALGDAHRRLGAFFDANPGEYFEEYGILPVARPVSLKESTTKRLEALLGSYTVLSSLVDVKDFVTKELRFATDGDLKVVSDLVSDLVSRLGF